MRSVASLYQVYRLSGSSFQLGLTGFFQALPFIVFGLFGGVLADAFDRRRLLLLAQALNILPGLALGLLTATGKIHVFHIYALGLVSSFVQLISWPARSAFIPQVVPEAHLLNAITLNSMAQQASVLCAPLIAGSLIDLIGLEHAYLVDASLAVPGLLALLAVRTSGKPEGQRGRIDLKSVTEGLFFVWRQRVILSLFLLDFGVTLVGFYRPILPVFATDIFRVGATGLGALYAAPAVGAMLGFAALLLIGDVRRKGVLALGAALVFGAGLGLLGFSRTLAMAIGAVLILGFTDAISVVVRRTVVQLLAPDALRGRASSLITVFAQATNALGALLAGSAAALMGAPYTMLCGSVLCILIVLAIGRAAPELARYRSGSSTG